jgi:hypothetical protein
MEFKHPCAQTCSGYKQAREEALNEVLRGIAREQNYREFREDQDGSAIGACKEIAGWVKALLATQSVPDNAEEEK